MPSCDCELKNQIDIQKQIIEDNLNDIWKDLNDIPQQRDNIRWSKPIRHVRFLIESLSRLVGICFHLKESKFPNEDILSDINNNKDIHSFNLVKFAVGVPLGLKYTEVTDSEIYSSVFSPFVEKNRGNYKWFSENVNATAHESSKPLEIANPEYYRIFKEDLEQLESVLNKLCDEFVEDDYFKSLLARIKGIYDRVNKLRALSWPETIELCDLCEKIPLNSTEFRYVAFAPEKFANEDDMLLFSRINWHMVFDPNQNNEDNKLLSFVRLIMGQSPVQLMTEKATLYMSPDKINWFFPFGEREKSRSIKPFTSFLRKRINGQNGFTYVIVDFNESSKKGLSAKMFESFVKGVFEEIYSSENKTDTSFNSNCRFITLKNSETEDNKLNEFIKRANEEDDGLNLDRINYLGLSASEFLNAAASAGLLHSKIIGSEIDHPLLTVVPEESIRDYNSSGISFMSQNEESSNPKKDFVCGHKISYSELSKGMDVIRMRNEYESFKRKILNAQMGQTFKIQHEAGAGGTTMSRRLAFDLTNDDKLDQIVVFLRDFESYDDTSKKLLRLSDQINNKRVIIISEEDVSDGKYKTLEELLDKSRNFVHVRVIHSTAPSGIGNIFLKATLNKEEKTLFLDKYKGYFLDKERHSADIEKIHEICAHIEERNKVEVVDFPYSFTESFIQQRGLAEEEIVPERGKYVEYELVDLSEPIKKFVEFVAFTYYFTNQGISASALKSIWSKDGKILLFKDSWTQNDRKHIFNLLKEEPGVSKNDETIWSPRYSAFALEILINLCGSEDTWPLSELSREFLDILPSSRSVLQLKTLLDSMFIQQAKHNFKNDSESYVVTDKALKKLLDSVSVLIGRAYKKSGVSIAGQIFDSLIDKYPEEWHYYAHKGRLLFESASYEKQLHNTRMYDDAELCICSAEEGLGINDDSDYEVVIHIHGMLWLRRLQSLQYNIDDASETMITEYVSKSEKYFKESIKLNIGSPYGWMSLAFLYRDAILRGVAINSSEHKLLKHCDSSVKDFCDKNSSYDDYVHGLDEAVETLSSFNFNEEEEEFKAYDSLRRDLSQIYGNSLEDIKNYQDEFENFIGKSNSTRIYYGKALRNCMINYFWNNSQKYNISNSNEKWSWKKFYSNIHPDNIKALKGTFEELKKLGDLDAYHDLFRLNRFSNKYGLEESFELLTSWKIAAEASEASCGIVAKRSLLWSNYYLGVAYSALLIHSDTPNTQWQKCAEECFRITQKYAKELSTGRYLRQDVLGKDHRFTWNSIIPYYDAYEDLKGQKPKKNMLKVNAEILDVDFPKARVGQLESISFRGDLFSQEDIGKTIENAIVSFTLGGPGLYNFDMKRQGNRSDNAIIPEEDYMSDSEPAKSDVSPTGSFKESNLSQIDKSRQKQSKQNINNSNEYKEAFSGTTYHGVLRDGEKRKVYPNDNLCNAKRPDQKLKFIYFDKMVSKDFETTWVEEDKVSFQIKYVGDKIYAINLQRED